MRKVRTENECCDRRGKLARKKAKTSLKKKTRNVTDCCAGKRLTCDEISNGTNEHLGSSSSCRLTKKKTKRMRKSVTCSVDIDKIFARIKPSLHEREKTLNIKHLLCVLEDEELVRLREIQKIRQQIENPEVLNTDEIQTNGSDVDKQITNAEKPQRIEASNEESREKISLANQGKSSKQVARDTNDGRKLKKSTSKKENECSSICSFDSEVDLSGLHLTKEDIKNIQQRREEMRFQPKYTSEKYESINPDAEE